MNRIDLRKFRNDLFTSLKGVEHDYTSGSIGKAILLLSIPMILEMIMESVFAVVDIFFVSKLGADAVSAVGITESLMTIFYAFSMGIGVAASAIISRRIGQKNAKQASHVALQSILITMVFSFAIAVPGVIFAPNILALMGAEKPVIEIGSGYTAIMLGGNLSVMLLFVINAIFRSAGNAAISMRVLWLANFINIVLDPCLIFGIGPFPELGVKGAAVATTIGRSIAVVYQLYLLIKGSGRIKIALVNLGIDLGVIKKIIKLSLGSTAQSLIATTSWIGLVRIIAEFGSEVLAGYTIAIRILVFVLLPSWGFSNAAATLTGQNLGARKPSRAVRSVWTTGFLNMGFMGMVSVIFILFSESFMWIFIQEPAVVEKGAIALRIISYGLLSYALGMVFIQAINGAGDTSTPAYVNFVCFWLIEIPLAYLLSMHFNFEERGIYFSILIAESVMTLWGIVIFVRGKWKFQQI